MKSYVTEYCSFFNQPVAGADNQWSDRKNNWRRVIVTTIQKKKIKRGFYCNKMNTLMCSNLRLSFTTTEAKKKDCNLGMKKIVFFSEIVCHSQKKEF